MNTTDNTDYNPAEDENQGVITKVAQGASAGGGVAQTDSMNPVTNQGPEPVKEEVNDDNDPFAGEGQSDVEANGVNDDMLAEEEVEDGSVEVDNETDQ